MSALCYMGLDPSLKRQERRNLRIALTEDAKPSMIERVRTRLHQLDVNTVVTDFASFDALLAGLTSFDVTNFSAGLYSSLCVLMSNEGSKAEISMLETPWLKKVSLEKFKRTLTAAAQSAPHSDIYDREISGISKIAPPASKGMMYSDPETGEEVLNKDLEQLVHANSNRHANPENFLVYKGKSYFSEAKRLVVERLKGEYQPIKPYTADEMKQSLSKAMSSSSPGFPFMGKSWFEPISPEDDTPVWEYMLNDHFHYFEEGLCRSHIYIQGARFTGEVRKNQRCVQMADALEKVPGHKVADITKPYYLKRRYCGQLGIKAVFDQLLSVIIKDNKVNEKLLSKLVRFWDISQWDSAQSDLWIKLAYFDVLKDVAADDSAGQTLIDNYEKAYMNRVLVTGAGSIKPNMLSSGSSITTQAAFVAHDIIITAIELAVKDSCGEDLFCVDDDGCKIYGTQGDDFFGITNDIDCVDEIISAMYESIGCRKKEGVSTSVIDNSWGSTFYVDFLGEVLYFKTGMFGIEHGIWRWLSRGWKLKYYETINDRYSSASMDRLEYNEYLASHKDVDNLKVRQYYSLFAKLDRYSDNKKVHDTLVNLVMKGSVRSIYWWCHYLSALNDEFKSPTAENIYHKQVAMCQSEDKDVQDKWNPLTYPSLEFVKEFLDIRPVLTCEEFEYALLVMGLSSIFRSTSTSVNRLKSGYARSKTRSNFKIDEIGQEGQALLEQNFVSEALDSGILLAEMPSYFSAAKGFASERKQESKTDKKSIAKEIKMTQEVSDRKQAGPKIGNMIQWIGRQMGTESGALWRTVTDAYEAISQDHIQLMINENPKWRQLNARIQELSVIVREPEPDYECDSSDLAGDVEGYEEGDEALTHPNTAASIDSEGSML